MERSHDMAAGGAQAAYTLQRHPAAAVITSLT